LETLEHVITVDQRRVAKKCIENEPKGKINLGRSRLKWLEYTVIALRDVGRAERRPKGKQ
jgi:hypothetical protein